MLGDISYIKLLYNPRVNIVFTYSHSQAVLDTIHVNWSESLHSGLTE